MKMEVLYILDCPWCVKTKELVRESLKELGVNADVKEILIDSDEKAREYCFAGSPTVRIDGRDIQENVSSGRCLPCEKMVKDKETASFVKQECGCGCRTYSYRGKRLSLSSEGHDQGGCQKTALRVEWTMSQ